MHKTQAEYHRREAARKRRALEEFVRECEASGISVVIETRTHAQGGTSGDHEEQETNSD